MKIYSKKEIRDIVIAFALFGAILVAGYYNKQSPKEKTNDNSDSNSKVLVNSALLIKGLPTCR